GLESYFTNEGTVGLPADSRGAITVGAADLAGQAEPFSAPGPVMGLELFVKPNVLAYDGLGLGKGGGAAYGTGLATPFAAGLAASTFSAGVGRPEFLQVLERERGKVLRVPAAADHSRKPGRMPVVP